MITFPIRPRGPFPPGRPDRSPGCRCHRPLMDVANDRCVKCGHWTSATVRHTWHQRAQQIARKRRKKAA